MQQNDASIFLEEDFYEESLADLERRHMLERDGHIAADIEIDLANRGPLYLYVKSRRQQAEEALRVLVDLDPNDAVSIAQAQTEIREYLRACEWIHGRMEAAEQAEGIINEEYGHGTSERAAEQDEDY